MASGTITVPISSATGTTTSNEYIDAKIVWSSVADEEKNSSTVTATLYYRRNNTGFTTSGTGTFSLTIYGTTTTKSTYLSISTEWVAAVSATKVVPHNLYGTANVTISATGSIPGTTLTSTNVSKEVTLDVISRGADVESLTCSTDYFTGTLTVKYTPKVATHYYKLEVNVSSDVTGNYVTLITRDLGQKSATTHTETFSFSADNLSDIYSGLPNRTYSTVRVNIKTYYTANQAIHNYISSGSINLKIPNDTTTQPTVTMKLSPVSDISGISVYAKGLTKVKATFTNGASPSGASTSFTYKMTVAGKDYASPYTSDTLTTTGSITVKGTITDSRGYSRTYSQNITVYDYTTPKLDSLSCSSTYFNGTITHKYTPPNNVFYTRCAITLGSTTIKNEAHNRASGQQTVSFSFEESDLSKIYNALPNSTSGTLKFTFQAFTDSGYTKQIGTDSVKEITLSIPDIEATKPTATMTLAPVTSLASPFNTLYIKGKTKVTVDLTSRAAKYGASIKSYKVTVGAQSGTPPFTSAYISTSNAITVTGTVTDSRGFSRTYTQTITPIAYGSPRIVPATGWGHVAATRCNSAGVVDSNGTHLIIVAKREYSKVEVDNVQKNFCAIECRYKAESATEYSPWVEIRSRKEPEDSVSYVVPNLTLEATKTYVVQIRAVDDIGDSSTTTITVSSQKVYMHRAGSINSIGIDKYAEEPNTVDIGGDLTVKVRGRLLVGDEASAALVGDIPSLPVSISDTGWIDLGIIDTNAAVTASSNNVGRNGAGCYYRVINGTHVYVAFNCACTYAGSTLVINKNKIPAEYCPARNAYAMVPTGGRAVVRAIVNHSGNVAIDYVQSLIATENTTSANVSWIDGYIDYWT